MQDFDTRYRGLHPVQVETLYMAGERIFNVLNWAKHLHQCFIDDMDDLAHS